MALRMRKNKSPTPPANCPLLACTAIIGGPWTPSIIWYLSAGARRFTELKSDIPPITARVLTKRLRELERQGIIKRHVMPTSPPSVEYQLSALGRELLPAIQAIVDVGMKLQRLGSDDAASIEYVQTTKRGDESFSATSEM
jgi:DNA-binding HxlR family transcriptional regulator